MSDNFLSPYSSSDDEYETPPTSRPSSPTPEDPIQPSVTIPELEPKLPFSNFSVLEPAAQTECPAPIDFIFSPLPFAEGERGILAYTLSVTEERVCFFMDSSNTIFERRRDEIALTDLVKGEIYHVAYITPFKMGTWSSLGVLTRRKYIERSAFACETLASYRQLIFPSLLVGWRVRDYEQRCATVVQMGELRMSMTSQKGKWLERLKLKTIDGETFMVAVERIIKGEDDKRWTVVCLELDKLPSSVCQGCHLEIVDEDNTWQSPVAGALFAFFSTKKTAATAKPIDNWPLLDRIYGPPSHCVFPDVPHIDYSIKLLNGGTTRLNPQQAEAVARYNSSSVPAFAIEAPPGSGKTMTAAAMAVSYRGKGVQLFLSTANIAVNNMALSLGKLEIGTRSPLHLMSSEGRVKLAEQAESPFSALSLARNQENVRVKIELIENRIIEKGIFEKEQIREQEKDIFKTCEPILDTPHDIYFATIDTILKRMMKSNKNGYIQEDTIKRQLESEVERIVIDEASQLTEAALNALILHFPMAQFALIGDSKQLPPFKYTSGEIVSELGHRSSIDVVKDKNNIPVIKLHEVYRASEPLISHYSNVFYEGKLKSTKNVGENPLACFGHRVTSPRLFWKVKNCESKQDGTSKVNDREIETLVHIITKLRKSNITEKDVMIISYYEAQRKKAAKTLKKYWKGYEVLTVDSAQGREKRIVIVLTTRTSVPAEAGENFFNSAKRLNVAVSRHQEALIVIGHPSIATVPNWTQVLSQKYFKHIEDQSVSDITFYATSSEEFTPLIQLSFATVPTIRTIRSAIRSRDSIIPVLSGNEKIAMVIFFSRNHRQARPRNSRDNIVHSSLQHKKSPTGLVRIQQPTLLIPPSTESAPTPSEIVSIQETITRLSLLGNDSPTSIERMDTFQSPVEKRDEPTPHASIAPTPTPPPTHHPSEVVPIDKTIAPLPLVDTGIPVYTLSVTDQRVCLFLPSRFKFIQINRSQFVLNDIKEGNIYHIPTITSIRSLHAISDDRRKSYIERKTFTCSSIAAYRQVILPALLLGSRVRDFEQRCAQVVQIGELILSMPAEKGYPKKLELKTVLGETLQVKVKSIDKNNDDRRWVVTCHTPTQPMPSEVKKGCLLEIEGGFTPTPRVTDALMQPYLNARQPTNWPLLSAIYGEPCHRVHPPATPTNVVIHLTKNADTRHLNPQQAEAVARYSTPSIPAFAIEAPPGSGKTMTAAAMAVNYKGKGIQLFLSTANVPVINMALELAKLDYGSLRAIHFISSECEGRMTEETRSPFSALSLAKASEGLTETIEKLEKEKERAPNDEERKKVQDEINSEPFNHKYYDIYFATIDMILGRLFKPNLGGRHQVDFVKKQLQTKVERIVIDEASQLTEAALNAIIHCFPKAQIVMIGDSKQLAPFKYAEGDVVSELSSRSALEAMKDKRNLPTIKLVQVYRASPAVMEHYNHVFYDGELNSEKLEPTENPLQSLGRRAEGNNYCLFWQVNGLTQQRGTSKVNLEEISALKWIVNQLRHSKVDVKDVMIISYYEAQRKAAEDALPKGYEILTVDSAQGREKRIVIVLTTRTAPPTDKRSFFTDPRRCNVAISRHKEALIVLGHPSLASTENWAQVLKYFKHVDDDDRA